MLMSKTHFQVTSYLTTDVAEILSVICNACLQHLEAGAFCSAERSPEMLSRCLKRNSLPSKRRALNMFMSSSTNINMTGKWSTVIDRTKDSKMSDQRSVQLTCQIPTMASRVGRALKVRQAQNENYFFAKYIIICVCVYIYNVTLQELGREIWKKWPEQNYNTAAYGSKQQTFFYLWCIPWSHY